MSVSAQAGYVSFAVQDEKYGSSVYDPSSIAWLNHRALSADVGFQQFADQFPPEIGAGLFSVGSFKMGAYVAGGMAINGRLKDSLGHLLFASAGKASTSTIQSKALVAPVGTLTVGTPSAGGAVTAGTHSYKVTFVGGVGETTPGTASSVETAIDTDGQTIGLTAIPLGGAGTIARKIYRTVAGNAGAYKLLATIANNSATTFSDTIADAALGASAPVTNTTVTQSGSTLFSVDPLDDSNLPWITLRKVIPGDSAGGYQQEFFYDCRLAALSITIPAMGLMSHEFSFVGRVPQWKDGKPTAGTDPGEFGAAFEDADTIGQGAIGGVTLSGFSGGELPDGGAFTHAQIVLANQFSTPQEEMIIGSYYPDDMACLSRGALVRLIYKWKDASLYRALNMAAADGLTGIREWTPIVKTSPVEITSQSPVAVPEFVSQYGFKFSADKVDWIMSPVTMAPRKLVQVELIGTIKQATVGNATWAIELTNDQLYASLK